MKFSDKALSWIFYSAVTASVLTAGVGVAGTYGGDAVVRAHGSSPAESLQKCREKWPGNPENWPGCQSEKIRSYSNAMDAHIRVRQISNGILAATVPVAALSLAARRRRRRSPSL